MLLMVRIVCAERNVAKESVQIAVRVLLWWMRSVDDYGPIRMLVL
jgi:hypothetical protein